MNNDETKTFEEFNLSKNLIMSIKKLGYEEPTEIQAKTIPPILEGRDVVGESATGSGKTLAFGCGAIETTTPKRGVQTLILLPTRELAEQVKTAIAKLDISKQFKILSIYGGVSINPQIDALRYSEIIIATPGRLKDHVQRGTIDLSTIKLLILDEADRMLDMGFVEDIEDIVKRCPKERQTLFFSATFPPEVQALRKKYLKNPVNIKVRNQVDPTLLKQIYYDVRKNKKLSLLIHLIKNESSDKIMVFCNTRMNSDFVVENLKVNQIRAETLHGGYTQALRTKVINNFKEGRTKILVCTDVAARGIHVNDVTHVYNYDIPKDANDYVHRIGRTARAGSKGLVINLLCDFDHVNFSKVMKSYDFNITKKDLPDELETTKIKTIKKVQGAQNQRNNRGSRDNQRNNRGPRSNSGGRGSRDSQRSFSRSSGDNRSRDGRSPRSNSGGRGSRDSQRSFSRGSGDNQGRDSRGPRTNKTGSGQRKNYESKRPRKSN